MRLFDYERKDTNSIQINRQNKDFLLKMAKYRIDKSPKLKI